MGLFDSDESDDDEKSFREEVNDIREEREQQREQQKEDKQQDGQLRITPNTLDEVTVSDDIQQWQYFTYDLIENIDKADAGVVEKLVSQSAGPPLPSDEVMNQLGKDGWELVETVEKPSDEVGEFTSHEGTMTTELIFRRPVSYQENDTDDE